MGHVPSLRSVTKETRPSHNLTGQSCNITPPLEKSLPLGFANVLVLVLY